MMMAARVAQRSAGRFGLTAGKTICRSKGLGVREVMAFQSTTTFPREREGNVYAVNWSLTEDGVTPVGDAYRNARVQLLSTRLGAKVEGGKVETAKVTYSGAYKVLEAGEGIAHGAFADLLAEQQKAFSSGGEIFVEDAGLGALSSARVGVRVVTDSSALALAVRSLLIPVPDRPVDHRARFDGWNFDPRWEEPEIEWTGNSYSVSDKPTVAAKGQRPIVAYVGGPGSTVAVQFVEANKRIVGANVSAGGAAPVRALIEALGLASSVLINEQNATALALPSLSLVKGGSTVVVVGADDALLDTALASSLVYGAYNNLVLGTGVTALWNGVISAPKGAAGRLAPPVIVNNGKAAVSLAPDNLANPAKAFVFFEKGKGKSTLGEDEAVKRIVALTDDSKAAVAKTLFQSGVKFYTASSIADIDL